MIYLTDFEAAHISRISLQPSQAWIVPHLEVKRLKALEGPWAVTIMRDGLPVLCTGALAYWEDRAMLWGFVGKDITARNFLEVHHLARAHMNGLPFRRLEMYVDVDFTEGHRWAKTLGFTLEAPRMRGFQMNGEDSALYAKIKER